MRRIALAVLAAIAVTPVWAEGFREVSREGRLTEYEGQLSLTGRFERRQDAETLVWRGDRVCFYPDAPVAAKLPAPSPAANGGRDDSRFFCFSNHRAAMDKFQLAALPPAGSCGVSGKASVVISRYTVESGNVFDQAWLDSVQKVDDKTPLACL